MKLALLTPFYPYRGGIAQFSDRLYQELEKENEVKVFSYSTLYPKILFPGKTQYVPNPIEREDMPSSRILSSINPFTHARTAKAINEYAPDVLIVAYWMPFMAIALSRVCKKLNKGIKVIGLVHNALPHERSWFDKTLAMRFFRECNGFITMSEGVATNLKTLGLSVPTLALEHPIYDHYPAMIDKTVAQEELGLKKDKKTLLFFGLIRSYKGLDLLIGAMNLLDDSYQLVIAGECYGSFSSYQQLICLSKNSENIKVLEHYIPDEMVSTLFSASDVLVLPYRSATQSGVVAVAYQMETPMVATNVGALGSAVRDSGTGVVVDEVSAKELARGIKAFFDEEESTHPKYMEQLRKEKERLSWFSFANSLRLFISNLH